MRLLLTRLRGNTADQTEPEVPFETPLLLVNAHCAYLVLGELLGKLLKRSTLRWCTTAAYTRHLNALELRRRASDTLCIRQLLKSNLQHFAHPQKAVLTVSGPFCIAFSASMHVPTKR
mmetsp:Transcript_31152/g.66895  ORF Transcript_31152/g.66895 Transcript_31152/m.66895 type:complete len:118 (+) Transcript_31152:108-461(+)